ncbi:hypothetical protein [Streptomyces sp. NPDC059743]|uniref:hypothetical protein n=1 Tax=Streptomyces sp. NPDC059743 TaxID=3346928 RepID=UPI00364AF055
MTGIGYGGTLAILDGAAISSVELPKAGVATGMYNAFRLTGDTAASAIGGSLLVTVTAAQLAGKVANPDAVTEQLNGGIHTPCPRRLQPSPAPYTPCSGSAPPSP